MELGEQFLDNPRFDELFEAVLGVAKERESDAVLGRMLLQRGAQKLRAGKPYETIRLLGRAQQKLALHESRDEMVLALALGASAYEAAGLLWAARSCMLLASNQALAPFWEHGQLSQRAVTCLSRLIWLELQLGRVPCVFAWTEAMLALRSILTPDEENQKTFEEEWTQLDGVFGALLLRTGFFDLKSLGFVPTLLERFHLYGSWMALLYALGHEDTLRAENVIPPHETEEEVLNFFHKWASQPVPSELRKAPEFLDTQTVDLRSNVLGCEIVVSFRNDYRSLLLAESVLGTLEAFLATSLDASLIPHTPRLQLKIVPSDATTLPLDFQLDRRSHNTIEIYHPTQELKTVEPVLFQEKMIHLIGTIVSLIAFVPEGVHKFAEKIVRDEVGLGRALLITDVKTFLTNILGNNPKLRLSDWDSGNNRKLFFVRRKNAWDIAVNKQSTPQQRKAPKIGTGTPPAKLLDIEHLKHTQRRIFSLIDVNLWNKANWSGTVFAFSEHPDQLPWVGLAFTESTAAKEIFEGWTEKIGREDTRKRLRISIITGIDRRNLASYRVLIGENPDWTTVHQGSQFVFVTRINTMTPTTQTNLNQFLKEYEKKHKYLLAPAHYAPNGSFSLLPGQAILKEDLVVRPAWQIGEHDPDSSAIRSDDDVFVPDGIKDPPILRTIARIGKKRSS
jgi:hypothetical protein